MNTTWVQMFGYHSGGRYPDVGYARCRRTEHMIPPARRQRPRGGCFTACSVSRGQARQAQMEAEKADQHQQARVRAARVQLLA